MFGGGNKTATKKLKNAASQAQKQVKKVAKQAPKPSTQKTKKAVKKAPQPVKKAASQAQSVKDRWQEGAEDDQGGVGWVGGAGGPQDLDKWYGELSTPVRCLLSAPFDVVRRSADSAPAALKDSPTESGN